MDGAILKDGYEHYCSRVVYAATQVPGRGAPAEMQEAFTEGCKDGECGGGGCSCLQYGPNYLEDTCGRLVLAADKFGDRPVLECHARCTCPDTCRNRCVQFGPAGCLDVFQTDHKGLGLRTKEALPRGAFVCEYAGEVIGVEEARRRDARRNGAMNYVMIAAERTGNETLVTCVDPTAVGNIGRYINHSCEPNCAVVPVRVGCPVPLLCIFASRGIEPWEELTYDYGGGLLATAAGRSDVDLTPCLCQARLCNKWLPFNEI